MTEREKNLGMILVVVAAVGSCYYSYCEGILKGRQQSLKVVTELVERAEKSDAYIKKILTKKHECEVRKEMRPYIPNNPYSHL